MELGKIWELIIARVAPGIGMPLVDHVQSQSTQVEVYVWGLHIIIIFEELITLLKMQKKS